MCNNIFSLLFKLIESELFVILTWKYNAIASMFSKNIKKKENNPQNGKEYSQIYIW